MTAVAAPTSATHGRRSSGLMTMLRIQVRTGWKPIAIWVVAVAGTYLATLAGINAAFPTPEALQEYGAAVSDSAAIAAINGTPYGADTLGGVTANEFGFLAAIMLPLLATHLIIRSTRTPEQSGLLELLQSRCVARWSPTAAAVILTTGALALIAVSILLSLLAFDVDADDATLYALSLLGLGAVWVGIVSGAAQIARRPGTVYTISLIVLGFAYATRAVGDVRDNGWKWLSALAWQQETRPFDTDPRWWPLLLAYGVAIVLVVLALVHSSRRDLGSGLLATRAGPARAARHERSTLGIAIRAHRATILGWVAGTAAVAFVFAVLMQDVADAIPDNPAFTGGSTADGIDVYLALTVTILVLMAAACAIQSLGKLRSDELGGRLEPTLARSVSRSGWLGGQIAVVVVGFVLVTLMSTLVCGVIVAAQLDDSDQILSVLGAGASYLAAIALFAGVAVLLFGWLPHYQSLLWIWLGYSSFAAFVAPTLDLDEWLLRLSPLYSVGNVPADDPSASGIAMLLALAVTAIVLGVFGFRRRDIPSN